MSRRRINVHTVSGDKEGIIIHPDRHRPGRIFCAFPRFASLTEQEAIAVANRLADVLEEGQS